MAKGTKYGRESQEAAWQSAEVDALYRLADDGPVIIDLPQAVDAAGNNHARRMLLRDVDNLRDFFGRYNPALLPTQYGPEIWALYEKGLLRPDTVLSGLFEAPKTPVDLAGVVREIDDARAEDAARRLRMGQPPG